MADNIVFEKSKRFALRIIKLYKYLCGDKKEFVLSKQILRSGTSIGANISEAIHAMSKKEFIAKMNCVFRRIRTVNPEASGQQSGNIRTPCRLIQD